MANPELNDMLPFVRQWYAGQTHYLWHDEHGTAWPVLQGDGGEQGDALMPALFCLALREALEEMQGLLPNGSYFFAYLDDVYVICDHVDTHQCYEIVRDVLLNRCHINVNVGKLAAWSKGSTLPPPHVLDIGADVWKGSFPVNQQGIKVVGTPVGTDEYIAEFGHQVVGNEVKLLEQIPKLASLQASWLLLYFCAVPKVNHLLRTLPPSRASSTAETHDAAVLDVFCKLFSVPEAGDWDLNLHKVSYSCFIKQVGLPQRLAGCGLRNSLRSSPAAYWASWGDSLAVIHERYPGISSRMLAALDAMEVQEAPTYLQEAEMAGQHCDAAGWTLRPDWTSLATGARPPQPEEDELSLGEWQHGWQYHASNALEQAAYSDLRRELALPALRSNAQCTGKSRICSSRGRFSSSWLTAYPGTEAMTFLDDELRAAIRGRLGLAVTIDGPDPHGHRRLAESLGGRTHARHTTAVAAWRQVFVEAGGEVPDRNVERMLAATHVPVPPGDMRRLDLVVPGLNVARGLPLFCDITVLTPISRRGGPRPSTSNNGGRLLEQAERDNNSTYQPVIDSGLGALYCLGFEVYGRWSRQAIELIPLLAREKARCMHPRLRRGVALAFQTRWTGLIAVAVQKAVAQGRLRGEGADLATTLLEEAPPVADLPL